MFTATISAGRFLAKRYVEESPKYENLDTPHLLVLLLNFVLFIPVFFIIWYTLPHVHTTLAAVEDHLPAYEPVALNPDEDDITKAPNGAPRGSNPNRPVTSSLRATNRMLRSTFGWRSIFHGFAYALVLAVVTVFVGGFLRSLPFVPFSIAHLLATVAVAPLSTAWVHAIIAAPAPVSEPAKSFLSRFRATPARKVYAATWFPTFIFWAASNASILFPTLLAGLIGFRVPEPRFDDPASSEPEQPQQPIDGSLIAKAICLLGVTLGLQMLLVVPAHTALKRVQASLLPANEDTLVPFDRSFGGRVEPEVVAGRGFATFGAAVKTVTTAAWIRIILLRIKIFFVTIASYILMSVALAVQFVLLQKAIGPA